MQLTENRAATVLVCCEAKLKQDMDYDLFGWAVGETLGLKVPALMGIGAPTTSQLVKMNSALNTGGQVRMGGEIFPEGQPEEPGIPRHTRPDVTRQAAPDVGKVRTPVP